MCMCVWLCGVVVVSWVQGQEGKVSNDTSDTMTNVYYAIVYIREVQEKKKRGGGGGSYACMETHSNQT